ncbi:hypothetical protein C5167_047308 [Papaver somniferum]|uniref:Uncharacterized protein n=1 Tax=Papaver somniferum TaxID=3469 RepID=A0A4Y7LHR8_PAPSO|nr:hypothetical protein C5167_047308 [Papaver somniferum]
MATIRIAWEPNKWHHYSAGMSRRTRKPMQISEMQTDDDENNGATGSSYFQIESKVDNEDESIATTAHDTGHHQLGKLIMSEGHQGKAINSGNKLEHYCSSSPGGGRFSLSHHFIKEEKNDTCDNDNNQLMVIKQKGVKGIKYGKLVKKYMTTVLDRLVKKTKNGDKNHQLGSHKKAALP